MSITIERYIITSELMLKIKNEPYLRRKIKGLCRRIFNKLENNNMATGETNGEYRFIQDILSFYSSPNENVELFDCGANVGDYTNILLEYSEHLGCNYRIHSFEPLNICWKKLEERFKSNPNIKLNNVAVSDQEGEAQIYFSSKAKETGHASLYKKDILKGYHQVEMGLEETIKITTLAQYITANNINHVNLLKFDIEGHELAALKGLGDFLNPDFIDAIQFEYGIANFESHTSLYDLFCLFENSGFELYKIMPTYLEKRKYEGMRMETFQYANYAALSPRKLGK